LSRVLTEKSQHGFRKEAQWYRCLALFVPIFTGSIVPTTYAIDALTPALAAETSPANSASPTRRDLEAAIFRATRFMYEEVALNGGYVWVVSEDLSRRWGEVTARPSQIWLQGGTESVGQVMLDAYEATHNEYFLDVARKAANALVYGQHLLGGWHYFIDFDPTGVQAWYETSASKFRFGYEEYRYFYGNATFDDSVTQDAAQFLLRFYNVSKEAAYREPLLKALDFILLSQYPNGAWPQRFPLRDESAHDGFADYTSFYTLNDGAAQSNIELLLSAYESFGHPRYLEGARLGVDALMALQGPEDQGCWAEQYGFDMKPIAARTHEPAGFVVRESIGVMTLLARFYLMTGDRQYLEPIPACLNWFDRINRESMDEKYPRPRYWEPGSNRPIYVVRTGEITAEGYGTYIWTTDPAKTDCDGRPCAGDGKPIVDVDYFREQYNVISNLASDEARADYLEKLLASAARRSKSSESVIEIMSTMDERGAWITDGISVNQSNASTEVGAHPLVRGYSTRVFTDRLSTLIEALNNEVKSE
jgi:PelA/Pel-15E family pectate lyase